MLKPTGIFAPKIIQSFVAGFNAVANHIFLILMPVALDLLYIFGPRLRIKNLLEPYIHLTTQNMLAVSPPEMVGMVEASSSLWETFIQEFTLLSVFRTFPIGIPSLLSNQWLQTTPLGNGNIIEIESLGILFLGLFVILCLGIVMGSLYFNEVERWTRDHQRPFSFQVAIWQILQSFLLSGALVLIFVLLLIPATIVVSLVSLLSPMIGQVAFFVFMLLLIWILIPLFFSPHGIFASHQNILISMITSFKLVRIYLPGTGFFLLLILLFSQGFKAIWLIPPSESWLILVGIVGHAFITTSLLAGSFVYFRGGMQWMKYNLDQVSSKSGTNDPFQRINPSGGNK